MLLRYPWFSSLIVSFFLMSGGAQAAANIHIDDTAANGLITVTWSGFLSLSVNGGFPSSSGTATSCLPPAPGCDASGVSFFGSYSPSGNPTPDQTLYFVDPATHHLRDKLSTINFS